MYFSTAPMVTVPWPDCSMTQLPSHSRSCGQMRPQISGMLLVAERQLVGLLEPPLGGQLQPVGDVVLQRAMDLAERHAALRAARGLRRRTRGAELGIDLAEVARAQDGLALFGHAFGTVTNCIIFDDIGTPRAPMGHCGDPIAPFGARSQKILAITSTLFTMVAKRSPLRPLLFRRPAVPAVNILSTRLT